MKARVIATEEANSTRTVSLVIVYVTLGTKKINALRSYCGDLITALARKDGRWEIAALRKNAEKLLKRIVAFFDDSGIRYSDSMGLSRLVFPFKDLFTPRKRKNLGLSVTPIGLVFDSCAQAVTDSLTPPVKPEDVDFLEWDKAIDTMLAAFTEKKQFAARKWLEMTEPVIHNTEA